jgi:hypothetical protein
VTVWPNYTPRHGVSFSSPSETSAAKVGRYCNSSRHGKPFAVSETVFISSQTEHRSQHQSEEAHRVFAYEPFRAVHLLTFSTSISDRSGQCNLPERIGGQIRKGCFTAVSVPNYIGPDGRESCWIHWNGFGGKRS